MTRRRVTLRRRVWCVLTGGHRMVHITGRVWYCPRCTHHTSGLSFHASPFTTLPTEETR